MVEKQKLVKACQPHILYPDPVIGCKYMDQEEAFWVHTQSKLL